VPELEQQGLAPLDEGDLEVEFADRAGQVEDVQEVQDVRVAGELLGKLAVSGGELGGKLEGATPTQPVQLIHDLLLERVAGPAVLRCRGSGPVALCLIADLVEQDDNLASGQSAYSPLASWRRPFAAGT